MARYVRRCPVRAPDDRVALSVDIVRYDRAIDERFFRNRTADGIPKPVLRDGAGTAIGGLPEGFPEDPPSRPQVRFTDWRRSFSHEIRLYKAGESAFPPARHALHALEPTQPPLRVIAAGAGPPRAGTLSLGVDRTDSRPEHRRPRLMGSRAIFAVPIRLGPWQDVFQDGAASPPLPSRSIARL